MGHKKEVPLPLHVNKVKARGKYYYYYRPGRGSGKAAKAIRIPGEPTDPAWWDEYKRLTNAPPPRINTNSFNHLIEAWQGSPEWDKLKPRTKQEVMRSCRTISEAWGDIEVRGLEPKHVLALRDHYADTPGKANNLIKHLSSMIAWSVPRGYRDDNPCREIKCLKIGEGYKPWPWEAVERARNELRPDLWHAAAIAVYTGQRLSDVVAMRRNALRDGLISVKQLKTGKELEIPVHADLWPVLRSIDHAAITFCANPKGKPWTVDGFKSAWRDNKPEFLKEDGLVFHGLRKTAVVTLLEAGCTDAEASAITGHSRDMLVHYAKRINRGEMAKAAIKKWEGKK